MSRPSPVEDVRWLLGAGESVDSICQRLGRQPDSLARSLHRAGDTDAARAFWRLSKRRGL